MKRYLVFLFSMSVVLSSLLALPFVQAKEQVLDGLREGAWSVDRPEPVIDPAKPLTVVVRGWLWDPTSRKRVTPMTAFPKKVNAILEERYGIASSFFDYPWTRLPKDALVEGGIFTNWASRVSSAAEEAGTCVNFMGHSAGAGFVYEAAAKGTPMGYMATLGLASFGTSKPRNVSLWANFYTSTHIDDVAGLFWANKMPSDINIDLRQAHKLFWLSDIVAEVTADAIVDSWQSCPGRAL